MSSGIGQRPKLFFGPGSATYVGNVADTTEHSHFAVQVCLGVDGDIALSQREEPTSFAGAVVASSVPHRLSAPQSRVVLLYYEPTGLLGEAFERLYSGISDVSNALAPLRPGAYQLLAGQCSPTQVAELRGRVEDALLGDCPAVSARDERIQKVVGVLHRQDESEPDVAELAASVGLSPSRLRHLFREQLGIPIRSYRLWRRMSRAVELIPEARSITELAHAAGFADSAHLSRAFRQLFGMSPTDAFRS